MAVIRTDGSSAMWTSSGSARRSDATLINVLRFLVRSQEPAFGAAKRSFVRLAGHESPIADVSFRAAKSKGRRRQCK
jgi:hypothetical protein